jgi:methionyl-tRNA formyltransferase
MKETIGKLIEKEVRKKQISITSFADKICCKRNNVYDIFKRSKKMIVCIAGKNNIAVEILIYLVQIGIKKENIYIISNKTDDGKDNWQRSLLKKANKMGIEIRNLEDVYSIENLLFLSLEFDKIVNPNKFKSNKLFNIHFSLLPKYKGMFTSIMPILNNEKATGVTLHKIDKGIDTGEIIAQKEFEIDLMDNARDVYHKYIHYGILLLKECLEKLLKKSPTSIIECCEAFLKWSTVYSSV